MSDRRIEIDCKCKSCDGTGLYQGLGERDGAAVICSECNGTGKATLVFEYDEFHGRVARNDIERVYETNPGICIGANEEHDLSDFGGMPYGDWASGEPFPPKSENRRFTCPAWWYQSANYDKKPDWAKCNSFNGSFSDCPHFGAKARCWARFDRESATSRKEG